MKRLKHVDWSKMVGKTMKEKQEQFTAILFSMQLKSFHNAMDIINAWCDANDVELLIAPKGATWTYPGGADE